VCPTTDNRASPQAVAPRGDCTLNRAIFDAICTDLPRIKDSRKSSVYPLVCLRFSYTLLRHDLVNLFAKYR
jgi:hypothetical protein